MSKNWFVVVSFKTELLSEFACQNGLRHFKDTLGIDFDFKNRKNVDNDICGVAEEYAAFQELIKSDYRRLIPHFFEVIREVSRKLIDFGKIRGSKSIPELSREDLLRMFRDHYDLYERAVGLIGVPAASEFALVDVLNAKYGTKFASLGGFDEVMKTISVFEGETATLKQRKDLLKLARKAKDEMMEYSENALRNSSFFDEVESYLQSYVWIRKTLLLGNDYMIETLVDELKMLSDGDPGKELEEIEAHNARSLEEYRLMLEKISDSNFKGDLELMRKLIFFRNQRLEWLNEGAHYFSLLLMEIARRYEISYESLIYYLPSEIENLLEKAEKVSEEELQSRLEKYALVTEDGKTRLFLGDSMEPQHVKSNINDSSELKGYPASPGFAKGKAKIVKDRSQLGKVEKGDILVARLTTPDFVEAMRIAGAVVTDIGGITSHAAIVSREFRIPCVVGTESATVSFKDGDIIEVDATKGIVRKVL
ncbi:MAG: PEP-utilizing enzyme [Candidatus Diapherotrites archaeon]